MPRIVISGWGNKQSAIRESNQGGNKVQKSTPNLLNGDTVGWFPFPQQG